MGDSLNHIGHVGASASVKCGMIFTSIWLLRILIESHTARVREGEEHTEREAERETLASHTPKRYAVEKRKEPVGTSKHITFLCGEITSTTSMVLSHRGCLVGNDYALTTLLRISTACLHTYIHFTPIP